MKIVFQGDAIAKKNSQMSIRLGKRNMIVPSKQYKKWHKANLRLLKGRVSPWEGSYPVELRFVFYRSSNRKFDFSNMLEGCQDLLQELGVIVDDDMNHVIPVIIGWEIDKENPRTEVEICEI